MLESSSIASTNRRLTSSLLIFFAVGAASATPQHRLAYAVNNNGAAALMLANGVEVDPSAPPPTISQFVPLDGGFRGAGQVATSPDNTQMALVSWKTTTKCEDGEVGSY
jgi:hypothetical protein